MITRLAVLTITFASLAVAQTVFLVRHAERTGEPDPPLNEDGRRRARELARTLHDANIRHALVSDTIRARETAEPTAHQAGARVEILPQEDVARFVRRVRALTKRSQNTLVVGHRKTVPLIAKASASPIRPHWTRPNTTCYSSLPSRPAKRLSWP